MDRLDQIAKLLKELTYEEMMVLAQDSLANPIKDYLNDLATDGIDFNTEVGGGYFASRLLQFAEETLGHVEPVKEAA